MNNSIYNELLEHIIETIEDQDLTDFDELHFHAFNEDYYVIGYKNASDWLDSHGVSSWEAIETVRDYEQNNFGECYTEVNSESVTNMFVYLCGEEILSDFDLDQDKAELLADLKLAAEG